MTLQDILSAKGSAVFSIEPGATVREAAKQLHRKRVGALLVRTESPEGPLLGIVSERDVLRAVAVSGNTLDTQPVSEIMTTAVITGAPTDRVEDVMGLMTARRIRHLPVMDQGRLVGVVSIGDVVKSQLDWLAVENRFMKDYFTS
jgi:CBS domain-containing protein